MRIRWITFVLLLIALAFVAGCKEEERAGASMKDVDISGTYSGTTTITEAKNSAEGEVTESKFTIQQNEDGTALIKFGSEEKEGAVGTYDKEKGEFFYDTGEEVSLQLKLTFSISGDTIAATGTMTTNQTGDGWTQEAVLDFKRQ